HPGGRRLQLHLDGPGRQAHRPHGQGDVPRSSSSSLWLVQNHRWVRTRRLKLKVSYALTKKLLLWKNCCYGSDAGSAHQPEAKDFHPRSCGIAHAAKIELVTRYRWANRRGSVTRRKSHSTPERCIHNGARGFSSATKSKAAPTPINAVA